MPYGFLSNISKDEVKVKYGVDIQQNYQSRYRGCFLREQVITFILKPFFALPKPTRAPLLDSY